jgi:hypothetical protein
MTVTISIHDLSIPVLTRALTNLSSLLDKAAAHAAARKFDPAVLVQARLFPDMFPLSRQVQIACDTAKGAAGRLAGVDIPKHEDTETTLEELKQRIAKTLDFVTGVSVDQMKGAESKAIELKFGTRTVSFTGLSYLTDFVLPNLFFHETITYALLRSNGVEVGKMDFLGST